jgi:hypothetical protein
MVDGFKVTDTTYLSDIVKNYKNYTRICVKLFINIKVIKVFKKEQKDYFPFTASSALWRSSA